MFSIMVGFYIISVVKTIPMFQVVKSMAISGTDLLEVPTIYIYIHIYIHVHVYIKGLLFKAFFKASISGNIPSKYVLKNGTNVPPF